jgi:hypothetical protein
VFCGKKAGYAHARVVATEILINKKLKIMMKNPLLPGDMFIIDWRKSSKIL